MSYSQRRCSSWTTTTLMKTSPFRSESRVLRREAQSESSRVAGLAKARRSYATRANWSLAATAWLRRTPWSREAFLRTLSLWAILAGLRDSSTRLGGPGLAELAALCPASLSVKFVRGTGAFCGQMLALDGHLYVAGDYEWMRRKSVSPIAS